MRLSVNYSFWPFTINDMQFVPLNIFYYLNGCDSFIQEKQLKKARTGLWMPPSELLFNKRNKTDSAPITLVFLRDYSMQDWSSCQLQMTSNKNLCGLLMSLFAVLCFLFQLLLKTKAYWIAWRNETDSLSAIFWYWAVLYIRLQMKL